MSKCNIFKPLSNPTGEFLMFSQYTEDLTKEQAGKSTYRVVPSKFVALELNLEYAFGPDGPLARGNFSRTYDEYALTFNESVVTGLDAIIPQIFQSYYENIIAYHRNGNTKDEEDTTDITHDGEADKNNRTIEFSTEMLWSTLQRFGLVNKTNTPGFPTFEEVKYIGDINIHSNRQVDSFNYDEVFCYIPTESDAYYYPIYKFEREGGATTHHMEGDTIEGWNAVSYPQQYPLNIGNIKSVNTGTEGFVLGDEMPDMEWNEQIPVPRNMDEKGHLRPNSEYNINAIIVYYDILQSAPDGGLTYPHRYRPMGIYLTGPVGFRDDGSSPFLKNTITKYITNNDAYGQGSSFGLRIMSRYASTPNATNNSIEVSTETGDYEAIATSMGVIADAIASINKQYAGAYKMNQLYKDHLAMFRNHRVNVPYPRVVDGVRYWFVNGRNTGVPCSVLTGETNPEEESSTLKYDIENKIIKTPDNGDVSYRYIN